MFVWCCQDARDRASEYPSIACAVATLDQSSLRGLFVFCVYTLRILCKMCR